MQVVDEKTLLIPDRRGNNRADSLRNIIRDPRVALLFLIPGVGETLRVNGTAVISTDPALIGRFPFRGTLPRTRHRGHRRAGLFPMSRKRWCALTCGTPTNASTAKLLPSAGTIMASITEGQLGGEAYDRAYPERLRATIY